MDIALSAREREVADLVADGLTNRQIAERLVISERTAEGHVEQIRNKLGFHSRTQIAGWVVERRRRRSDPVPVGPAARVAAIAVEVPRPIRVEVPRVPRAVVAFGLVIALVAIGAITFWPRTQPTQLVLVAGIGTRGYSGDDGPATAAQIDEPTSLAFDRDGALIFADSFLETGASGIPAGDVGNRTRIRRVDSKGVVRSVAGDLATLHLFNVAEGGHDLFLPIQARIAIGPDFMLYIAAAQSGQHWIGRIDEGGKFMWLAGGAAPTVPHLRTTLSAPVGLAIGSDGVIYVSNTGTSEILAIPPRGSIVKIAGTGKRGADGDGGPASSATFYAPPSIRLAPDGGVYIADAYNHRVRGVDHGGTVVAIAGTGARGFGGDAGPAVRAQLTLPTDIAFGPNGVMYIADSGNARVRAIGPDGMITTVAGPAGLVRPNALAVDANGTLYIADGGAHRIFKLARPSR